jgi:hypothetical protein
MRQGERFGLSVLQKSDLWRRWKAGQSLHEIGRTFGKSHSSIRCVVSRHGGFVPQSGDARCWRSHCLRERTSLYLASTKLSKSFGSSQGSFGSARTRRTSTNSQRAATNILLVITSTKHLLCPSIIKTPKFKVQQGSLKSEQRVAVAVS